MSGSNIFNLGTQNPVQAAPQGPSQRVRVSNLGATNAVYFKSSRPLSSTDNDGSIAAGAHRIFNAPQWLISAATSAPIEQNVVSGTLIKIEDEPTRERYNVQEFGACGDGTTDDTSQIQSAITAANTDGLELHFPAGTYLTTGNLSNFHTVRKTGPGAVKRGSSTFYVEPTTSNSNTIYCSPSGTGDGLSSSYPTTLANAASYLAYYPTPLRGTWTVSLAAGSYPGVQLPRAIRTCDDYLYIKGPTIAHPSEPTAIIDRAQDTNKTVGLSFFDYMQVWVQYVETKDFTSAGIQAVRHCTVRLTNCWDRGSAVGWNFNGHVGYTGIGGSLINNTTAGVQETFHIHRDFTAAGSVAAGTVIQSTGSGSGTTGLYAKEWCNGHTDYLTVQDCGVGVEMHTSTANVGNLTLKRNGIGIVNVNSEIHESTSILWGTGADACTARTLPLGGASSAIETFGWTGTTPVTLRFGHRPLLLVDSDYASTTVTGTTNETNAITHTFTQSEFALKGQKRRITAWGTITTLAGGNMTVRTRYAGFLGTSVTIPSTATGDFYIEGEMITSTDGNNQWFVLRLMCDGNVCDLGITSRTTAVDDASHAFVLSTQAAAVGDSITWKVLEVWG